jgi:DNA polymerase III epsilon subunit-like protein
MHRLFFFDTETNGLPQNYKAPPTQIGNWPEILSIAWEVWIVKEGGWTQESSEAHLIQPPEGLIWNKEAEHVHGISYVKARSEGLPIKSVLEKVYTELQKATHVIAHNLAFDKSVFLASMIRNLGAGRWTAAKDVCTMIQTIPICKIASTSPYATAAEPYKWPRLQELHQCLFKKEWDGTAHDALSDVQCMRTCYRELVTRGCLTVE